MRRLIPLRLLAAVALLAWPGAEIGDVLAGVGRPDSSVILSLPVLALRW